MGPLISAGHRASVAKYVPDDAPVAFRGSAPDGPGYWFPPTVLAPIGFDAPAYTDEVFGPVVTVTPFEDEAEAIEIANDTPYGLSGSIWTGNVGRAIRVARAVETGNLSVNSHSSVRYWTPFGGFKQSGLGRELGPDALDAFTEIKNVFISTYRLTGVAQCSACRTGSPSSQELAAASDWPVPAGWRPRAPRWWPSTSTRPPGRPPPRRPAACSSPRTSPARRTSGGCSTTSPAEFGRIDIAFNNAGISPPEDDSILTTGIDAWRRVQEINLTSVYLCCKYVIPHMQRQGKGSIINTASFVAVLGAATSQISYTASKGGVLAMSRELGVQFAREGIRVNALCPGPVNTPLLRELFAKDPERAARRLVHVPVGRFAEPEEIAAAVAFLASDDASFITASQFLVDGGIAGAYVTPL